MVFEAKSCNSVFPAHAGVILRLYHALKDFQSFSRTRGGDPESLWWAMCRFKFFPHTRG